MSKVKLYNFQKSILDLTKDRNRVAYYMEMGTGKTFVGSEKMKQLGSKINLLICQKSKVQDWINHFEEYYSEYKIIDLTKEKQDVLLEGITEKTIYVINYELTFRRKYLSFLRNFTLILDESSLIQNEKAKRTKFILNLNPENIILLSGTPVGGKYENLWSQCRLLGWYISKNEYWVNYIRTRLIEVNGFYLPIVTGYQNISELKNNLRDHGAVFLKSSDVLDLPEQTFTKQYVEPIKEYKKFKKDLFIKINEDELVGDNILKRMLYERQLCGQYNKNKLDALKELLESTEDRIIIFYNFTKEKDLIVSLCEKLKKPYSIINGEIKNLEAYNSSKNSVTIVQYQAGSMGLNLQKANKIIYFTLPLSSELFEQSKKRIHRIGQLDTCFYYYLITKGTIEEKILKTLEMRKDYTNELYREENYD